jgi:hypothetical protein
MLILRKMMQVCKMDLKGCYYLFLVVILYYAYMFILIIKNIFYLVNIMETLQLKERYKVIEYMNVNESEIKIKS